MPLTRDSIVRRVLKCEDLPTLPQVVQHVMDTVGDESSSAGDLTEILESDPVITARVLRLANSPFYGLRHTVDSVRLAVVIVGFETVKQLALATSVWSALQRARQQVLDPEDFWLHSLGAGKAAQLLAVGCDHPMIAPLCFTAALLHDFGKYVLALTLGEEYQRLVNTAATRGLRLWDVEQREFGVDHPEIARLLLERWGFPPAIVDAVKYQYTPEQYRGEHKLEVAIVSACSEISRVCGYGHGGDTGPLRLPPIAELNSGLQVEAITHAIATLPALRDDAQDVLHLFSEYREAS